MRLTAITALLAPLLLWAAPGWSAQPITKREAREGHPLEVNKRILGQVGDLLDRRKMDPKKPLRTPLEFQPLSTVPRTTAYEGLCRRDTLWVEFSKAGSTGSGADEPRRASGFTATSYFAFAKAPPASTVDIADLTPTVSAPSQTEPCRMAPEDGYFAAEDADAAAEGYLLLRSVIAEAPTATWAMDCLPTGGDQDWCRKALTQLNPAWLSSVADCDTFTVAPDQRCKEFRFGLDTTIRVFAGSRSIGSAKSARTIIKVDLHQDLILYHERNYD